MSAIDIKSEIAPLKKVLLHRPGNELLNLTPDTLERLLFDDIPFLPDAQKEHDEFANILKTNGVEVVYLEDLMAQVLEISTEIEDKFLRQFVVSFLVAHSAVIEPGNIKLRAKTIIQHAEDLVHTAGNRACRV